MKKKLGRPSKFDELTVKKLEEAFAIGCNDSQACAYSGVSRQAFYVWLKGNPVFVDRIAELKERPVLKARKTIYDNLSDPNTAKWYLERKQKDEFGNSMTLGGTGENGEFIVKVEVLNDNQAAQESGNRIGEYLTL